MDSSDTPPRAGRPGREETRRRLLVAAGRLFATKGIEATTLEEIAARAGFTRGAVYSNFRDKDDLVVALLTERVTRKLMKAAESARDNLSQLPHGAGRALAEQIRDDRQGHRLVLELLLQVARNARLRAHFAEPRRRQRQLIADMLSEHARTLDVQLPMPADQLAVVVLALVNGVAAEYMADPHGVDLDALPAAFTALWPDLARRAPAQH